MCVVESILKASLGIEKNENFLLSASGTGNVIRKIFVTLSYSFIGCDKIYNENWFESFSSEIRLDFGRIAEYFSDVPRSSFSNSQHHQRKLLMHIYERP